jgi:hypothetical protein
MSKQHSIYCLESDIQQIERTNPRLRAQGQKKELPQQQKDIVQVINHRSL